MVRRQRRTARNTVNINTTINVIRHGASYTHIIAKRIIDASSRTRINKNPFFIHKTL